MDAIRLASPALGPEEQAAVARVLSSGQLVQGREVEAFERALAARCGRAHAVAVSSGTAALELSLRALGVEGGAVIVPGLSWPSPAHAARLAGARVVLIDVDAHEWNGSPEGFELARDTETRAAIAIDQFGVPARLEEIAAALGPGVPIVEDAACAIGSTYAGKPCGSFGLVSCLSFHPRKVITTGEGGACLTDDSHLAAELRLLRNHGQRAPGRFERPAPNLRMTELQAAVGIAQLARLDAIVARRRALAERYRERLAPLRASLATQACPDRATRNEQTFGVVLSEALAPRRDALIARLAEEGIEAARLSYALADLPSLAGARVLGAGTARKLAAAGLALPLHTRMTDHDVDRVVACLARALGEPA